MNKVSRDLDFWRRIRLHNNPYTASGKILVTKQSIDGIRKMTKSTNEKAKAGPEPNWHYWASKEYWGVDEAAALMAGAEPGRVSEYPDLIEEGFAEFGDILDTMNKLDKVDLPIRPIQLIEYLDQSRLSVSAKLRRAVLQYERNPTVAYRALANRVKALEVENRDLKLQSPLDPRERKTLLSLVCGLAYIHYRYDPSRRSNVVKEIQMKLRELKINLSDDAIRTALNAAYELLPHHLIE
jgi:hypothetical protein